MADDVLSNAQLRRDVSALKMQVAQLRLSYLADHGVVEDPALAYAITQSVFPYFHQDGEHHSYADEFRIGPFAMQQIVDALDAGTITSSMGVEEYLNRDGVQNPKIAAGFALRYLYLYGFKADGARPLSELGLTSDAGFAFRDFEPKEISVW